MSTIVSNVGTEVDCQIAKGADFAATLIVTQANGSPLSLVNAAVTADIKSSNETSILQASFACGGNGAAGKILTFSVGALNGIPAAGDAITGGTSAATGTIVTYTPIGEVMVISVLTGVFQVGEVLHDTTQSFVTTATVAIIAATTLFASDGAVNLSLIAANNVLTPGATLTDPEGQYVWDMKVVLASGAVLRPYFGNVSVVAAVTP